MIANTDIRTLNDIKYVERYWIWNKVKKWDMTYHSLHLRLINKEKMYRRIKNKSHI